MTSDRGEEKTFATTSATTSCALARANDASSSSSFGSLVRVIGRWRPLKTPRVTMSVFLYVLGMYVAFYARAPVEITPRMRARYDAALSAMDEELGATLREAEGDYRNAELALRAATPFGWRFSATVTHRARVDAARRRRNSAERKLAEIEKKRTEAMRAARSELGLWSELGVGDAKALFKRSYERGKIFATRHTFWDGLSLILRSKSDESLISFFLRWLMIALSNFTLGMFTAIFSYAIALPGLIRSFSTSIWSAFAFYFVAVVAAVSVVVSILLAMYSAAAGGTYALVKYAGPALARLDAAEERRRARIGQRSHYDRTRMHRAHQD
ncbi:unnamed product [Ostreococcus tauri]|uniref:Unnamed product n=1 Tax=Ostreococcus tauri TaxID=70448 RepID=Q00UQ2_OSTTA|nr:unnamed product [Ostreococcus tauri]CAL57725.1 unnamed product [Ostreococcus tauri]|eukprot:XP_003083449.1 unnamed product [Ostreococcus tauri]